ncbi:MAG: FISUMP domain-containing protein [Bacteroidota bacterium]
MKTLISFFILLVVFNVSAYCQSLNNYVFTSSNEEYTEITGGTSLGNANSDDQRFFDPINTLGGNWTTGSGFPIGFDFRFGDQIFDRIGINNNGWIGFGKSQFTPSVNLTSISNYAPLSSISILNPEFLVCRIAGLALDLQGQPGSELRIETIGMEPNRECVIQWKNYRIYNGSDWNINFQIRLHESTNSSTIVYGQMILNGNVAAQVGLRGAPSSNAINYKSRTVNDDWTISESGTTSSSCNLNGSVFPSSGLTYTFTFPPPSLNLILFIEGLYDQANNEMNKAHGSEGPYFSGSIADQVTIMLAQGVFPYSVIYEVSSVPVNQNGACQIEIPEIISGDYYIVVSHRNSIDTWSSEPVTFNGANIQYNFTNAPGKAFGDNMKLISGIYCIYGGDVNHDGIVDTGDMSPVDNDASAFTTGYISTDVNGDGIIDTGDMTIIDNNASSFIGVVTPSVSTLPSVTTALIIYDNSNNAISGGDVTSEGGSSVTSRGVCWNDSPNPTLMNYHTNDGSGMGVFTSTIAGLKLNTTYFVRAFATNSFGTVYGNEEIFTTDISYTGEGVTDIDGNEYSTVVIGKQKWMSENLRVTHYRNGDVIPNVTGSSQWSVLSNGAYCWYNNDELTYKSTYGALYNWYAVADNRNLCPAGWHIPSNAEWTDLTNYLGGEDIAGGKMKEAGLLHWQSPNTGATNESGYNGIPGGIRSFFGSFMDLGSSGFFWSSTGVGYQALYRNLQHNDSDIGWGETPVWDGYSVRCLRYTDNTATLTTNPVTEVVGQTAVCGGIILDEGNSSVTQRGVCWSTSPNPTTQGAHTQDGAGSGNFTSVVTGLTMNTSYYIRAYAINTEGISYGNEQGFNTSAALPVAGSGVVDIDGNAYSSVIIGSQEWMVENLKATHYHNGDAIPNITDNTAWINLTTGAYCWYNNEEVTYKEPYGALYNWFSTIDNRNLCPAGWDVPDNSDWNTLSKYLEDNAGGKLKEAGNSHWSSPNTGATNDFNFTALPGGSRNYDGMFGFNGAYGHWWSSTEQNNEEAGVSSTNYQSGMLYLGNDLKKWGFSVRCLKEEISTAVITTSPISDITSTSAICGGDITDDGGSIITARGICWSTSPMPTLTDDFTVDGSGTGVFTSNIIELEPNTTYYVRAYATNDIGTAYGEILSFNTLENITTVTDIDGNVYQTVTIGNQTWMKENLKTTRYRNGTNIDYPGSNNTSWQNNTTGAYAWNNNDISWKDFYGALYNHYAVTNSNGLCPTDWHVPSDAEWTQLTDFISGGTSTGGSQLKSCRQVNSPLGGECNTSVHPRWIFYNTSIYGTDDYGFSALPGGYRNYDGTNGSPGGYGTWWSGTVSGANAWGRSIVYTSMSVTRSRYGKTGGYNVRCMMD